MSSYPATLSIKLGFEHEHDCPMGDHGLLFVERYIGEESRRIKDADSDTEDGNLILISLTLGADAVTDEPVEMVRQWIECESCAGAKVEVPSDASLDYE